MAELKSSPCAALLSDALARWRIADGPVRVAEPSRAGQPGPGTAVLPESGLAGEKSSGDTAAWLRCGPSAATAHASAALRQAGEELFWRWCGSGKAAAPVDASGDREPDCPAYRAAAFVEPEPGFQPEAEARFADLYLVRNGPSLLLAYQVLADGRLRRAYSHSGFLLPAAGRAGPVLAAGELRGDPVVGDAGLARLSLMRLARTGGEVGWARQVAGLLPELAGTELELVRWYRDPAPPRSAEHWRRRDAERSAAEEKPYTALVLALLQAAGLGRQIEGLRLHDPACHTGVVLARLAETLPGLKLTYADQDPFWIEATGRLLAGAGSRVEAQPPGSAAELPGLAEGSLDLLLLRCCNRGVTSPAEAWASLARAAACLAPGGAAFVYGYSFPLLNTAHFAAAGLEPLLC
ncbi:MAG: hypothetical protein FJ125_10790, partial [Deltaproteobacteria bacterium]|nr:hypothetical protein [Deltaproteobacteria bacterium]